MDEGLLDLPSTSRRALTVAVTCRPWKFRQVLSRGAVAVSCVCHTIKHMVGSLDRLNMANCSKALRLG